MALVPVESVMLTVRIEVALKPGSVNEAIDEITPLLVMVAVGLAVLVSVPRMATVGVAL